MLKKLLAFTMAALLITAAGCSNAAAPPAATSAPSATTSAAPAATKASPAAASGQANSKMPAVGPYADHQVWNMSSVQLTDGRDYNDPNDPYTMFFRNTFNMEWDMVSTPWDVWQEKIRVWASAGDLPDYCTFDLNYVDYVNFAQQGLIKKLPDDWKTKWPGLAAASDVSAIGPMLEKAVGGSYGLPKPIFYTKPNNPLSSHSSVWIRKDYLDKLGIAVKDVYTTDELLNIAQKMKDANVSGLGQKFIPIDGSASYLAGFFVAPYNPYHNRFEKMSDGKYEWGARLDGTWTGLQKYKDAYSRGLLNGDFLSLTDDQAKTDFQTGMCGIYKGEGDVGNATTNVFQFTKNTGIPWKNAVTWVTQTTEDGYVRELETINFWTLTIFSPNIDQAKFERIMDYLNFTTDPEVQLFIRLGIEGKDWNRDASGNITVTRPKDENGNFLPISQEYLAAGPMYTNATILSDDFGLKDPSIDADLRAIVKRNYDMKQKYGGDKGGIEPTDWFYQFFTAPNFNKISPTMYQDAYAKIVTAPGDLRANYDKWLSDNKDTMDRVCGELNAGQ